MSARIKNSRIEYFIYILFWGVLVLAPFLDNSTLVDIPELIEWNNIYHYWLFLSPVFILFLLNNYILLPYIFIRKKQKLIYFVLVFILMLAGASITHKEIIPKKKDKPIFVKRDLDEKGENKHFHPHNDGPPKRVVLYKYAKATITVHDVTANNRAYYIRMMPPPKRKGHGFVDFMFDPSILQISFMLMILVLNGLLRFYFVTIHNEKRLKTLENKALKSELEYLKYQINPHFLMNTLNNIHALIDIDKEKAQKAIIYLSKMMHYMLYESSCSWILIEKEIAFLKGYIDLMRLRYSNKLTINVDFPAFTPACNVPSLLFISFIENSFKHGIRLDKNSLIDISLKIEQENIVFKCRNTIGKTSEPLEDSCQHGIGLDNARKRLSLLYDDKYILEINRDDTYYNVLLKIPITYDEMYYNR